MGQSPEQTTRQGQAEGRQTDRQRSAIGGGRYRRLIEGQIDG